MVQRTPSLVVTDRMSSSIRRRSGGHPNQQASLDNDANPHPSFMVQVQDTDKLFNRRTVLLVQRSSAIPSTLPIVQRSEEHPIHQNGRDGGDTASLSPIPLTPRPCPPSRVDSDSSFQSTHTRASQIPRLPTPDFGDSEIITTTRSNKILGPLRSLLPRGLSFVSLRVAPTSFLSSASTFSRPQSVRSRSGDSFYSTWSSGTSSSIDSGHHALIPSIGTTNKFTHKWPKPQSLRNLEVSGGDLGNFTGTGLGKAIAIALEEGQGLGMSPVQKWTMFKWCLLFSVSTVFAYGAAGLVCAIMTWFRTWDHADVMYVADNDILILITLAASIMVLTALVGISGVFLNSRPILAIYTLLLWPALTSLLVVGYISYKRMALSLDHKLNLSWSQYYTPLGRLLIQDSLRCCGFYSALHEATPSKRCYPRTPLPGCKGKLYRFERANLEIIWSAAFALAPLHLLNVAIALLCANHMTKTFGKGITPKKYRLSSTDVKADAEKILNGMSRAGVRAVIRPEMSRASSGDTFREDREERLALFK